MVCREESYLKRDHPNSSMFGFGKRHLLTPDGPLRGREEAWSYFDQARDHLKDRNLAPQFPFPSTKPFLVQIAGNAREGKILNHQLHQLGEDHALLAVELQPLAVIGNAQAVGNVLAKSPLGWRFLPRQFAPPLDRYQLPPGCRALLDQGLAKWPRNHISNPFIVRHRSPPQHPEQSSCQVYRAFLSQVYTRTLQR